MPHRLNTGELEVVTISVQKVKKVKGQFLFASLLLVVIGAITMTYQDTVLFNSYWIGVVQVVAGIMGVISTLGWMKNTNLTNNVVSTSIIFRAISYIIEIFYTGFRPGLINSFIIWSLIYFGFYMLSRTNLRVQELEAQEAKWKALREFETERTIDQVVEESRQRTDQKLYGEHEPLE